MLFTGSSFLILPEVSSLQYSFDDIVLDNATGVAEIGFSGTPIISNSGLIVNFSFDEGTGVTVYNSYTGGYTGTLINSPTWTNGIKGNALQFNAGISSRVDLGHSSYLNYLQVPMTIAGWIFPISSVFNSRTQTIIGQYESTSLHKLVKMIRLSPSSAMEYYTSTSGGGFQLFGTLPIIRDKWSFIAVSVAGNTGSPTITLMVDGASQTGSLSALSSTPNITVPLIVGDSKADYPSPAVEIFNGIIDEIRIYDRALSTSEMSGLYNYYTQGVTKFKFSSGKVFSPTNKVINTYNIDTPFSISGNIATGSYSYYVNDDLISNRSSKIDYPLQKMFVNLTGTNLSSNISLACAPIDYTLNVNTGFTALTNLSGTLTNNSSTKFKVFSSEITQFASSEPLLSGSVSGIASGTGTLNFSFTDLNESRFDSDLEFLLTLNTSIGELSQEFTVSRLSGMEYITRKISTTSGDVNLTGLFNGSGEVPNVFTFLSSPQSTTKTYYISTANLKGETQPSTVTIALEPVSPASGAAYRSDYVTGFTVTSSGRYQYPPTAIFTGYYYIDGLDYNLSTILLSSGCSGSIPIIFSGVNGGSGASGNLITTAVLFNNVYDVGTHTYYLPQSFQMMSGGTGYVQSPVSIVRTGNYANCRDVAAAYGYNLYNFRPFNGSGRLVPSAAYLTGEVQTTTGFVSGSFVSGSGSGYFLTGIRFTNIGSGYNQTLYPKVVFKRNALDTYTGNASGTLYLKQTGLYNFNSQWGVNTGISSEALTGMLGYSGTVSLEPEQNYVAVQVGYSGHDNTTTNIVKLTVSMGGGDSLVSYVTGNHYYDITTGHLKKNSNLNPILFNANSDLSFLLTQDELDTYYSSSDFINNQGVFQDGDLDF